jgi:hypothetical protein
MTIRRFLAAVAALVLVFLALLSLEEAYEVGVRGTDYNFGTEAMLFHGGRAYRSAQIYTATTLAEGVLFLLAAVGLGAFALRARTRVSPFIGAALIAFVVHFVSIGPLR